MLDYSNLTSDQYAYLLLQQLKREISCDWIGDRMVATTYFGAVFKDPTVILTYSAYTNFYSLMQECVKYCAANNLRTLAGIVGSNARSKFTAAIKTLFTEIGCTVDDDNLLSGVLKITAPSGTVYELYGWHMDGNGYNEYLNSAVHCTDSYWNNMRTVYWMENKPIYSLSGLDTQRCGENATFTTDGSTIYISGTGKIVGGASGRQSGITVQHDINNVQRNGYCCRRRH